MDLGEARSRIGDRVIYQSGGADKREAGVITSVNDRFVFVRYGADSGHGIATYPEDLEFMFKKGNLH